jgi:hypothetical protein
MKREINVKLLQDVQVDGIDTRDYPDFCDAFIAYASWKDTGEDLTEEELNDLNENYRDFVYDCVNDHLY